MIGAVTRAGNAARLAAALFLLPPLLFQPSAARAAAEGQAVIDFETAVHLLSDRKANRVPQWVEKGRHIHVGARAPTV